MRILGALVALLCACGGGDKLRIIAKDVTVRSVVATDDGPVLLGSTYDDEALVIALDPTGKTVRWEKRLEGEGMLFERSAFAGVAKDGTVVVLGCLGESNMTDKCTTAVETTFGAKGEVVAEHKFDAPPGWWAAIPSSDGDWLLALDSELRRVGADGTTRWTAATTHQLFRGPPGRFLGSDGARMYDDDGNDLGPTEAPERLVEQTVVGDDTGWLVLGMEFVGTKPHQAILQTVWRLDRDGKLAWKTHTEQHNADGESLATAAAVDGGWIVVSTVRKSSPELLEDRPRIRKLSNDGTIAWTVTTNVLVENEGHRVVTTPGGFVVFSKRVVYPSKDKVEVQLWAHAYDAAGKRRW